MDFTSNPGASRWIVTTPGPGLVRHQVKSAKKQQLLQEAASMTPNSSELMEQLGMNDLSPQDGYKYGAALNDMLNEYMGKYKENPYYAFSREGVEKVRGMQTLVRDPRINAVKQAFKTTQENFKKKTEEGLGSYAYTRNGNLMVIDEEGNLRDMMPDKIDLQKHHPVTVEQAYQYTIGNKGFHDQNMANIKALTIDMEDPEKVIDQVNKWFQGLGQHTQEAFRSDLSNLVSEKTTSNAAQLKSRMSAILSDAGLPNNFRDTIYSQYYTNELMQGRKPTRLGAEKALYEMVGRIADGHNVFKEDLQANPVFRGAADRKEALTETSPWLAAASGAQAGDHPLIIQNNTSGRWGALSYKPIPTTYLEKSFNQYKDEETNLTQPKKNLKDMAIFRVASPEDIFIPDLTNAGKLVKVPAELKNLFGEIVVSNNFLADAPIKFDKDGQAFVHGSGENVDPSNSVRSFIVDAKLAGERSNLPWESGRYSKAIDFLSGLGYASRSGTSAEYEEYKKNVNDPDFEDIGFLEGTGFYDLKLFTKYNPDAMKSLDNLPVGFESKANTTLDFMDAMPSSNNNSATQDPGKGNPFMTFDALGN
jgi:hypothetical protein